MSLFRSVPVEIPYEDLPVKRPLVKIVAAKPGKDVIGLCLSDKPYVTCCHYFNGGTMPCLQEECAFVVNGVHPAGRVRGYVNCLIGTSSRHHLVELTDNALRELRAAGTFSGLRGKVLRVARLGNGPKSPVYATVEVTKVKRELPPAIDVAAVLGEIWDIERLPLRARLIAQALSA